MKPKGWATQRMVVRCNNVVVRWFLEAVQQPQGCALGWLAVKVSMIDFLLHSHRSRAGYGYK
jgi:hypothetical protein